MKRPRKTLKDRIEGGQWPPRAQGNNLHALSKHEYRCKSRITEIITQGEPHFLTFTLEDKYLGLKMDTYLQGIKKALKQLGAKQYIINIDYGTKKGRLHFHVVATFPKQLDYIIVKGQKYITQHNYHYGLVHCEFISHETKTATQVTKYITKVYNHAHKHTAGVIIYSRRTT